MSPEIYFGILKLIKPDKFKVPYSMKSLKELKRVKEQGLKGLQLQKNGFKRFEN